MLHCGTEFLLNSLQALLKHPLLQALPQTFSKALRVHYCILILEAPFIKSLNVQYAATGTTIKVRHESGGSNDCIENTG